MRTYKPNNFSWLMTAGVILILFSSAFCNINQVSGSGHVITKDFQVENFNALEVSGSFDVELSQGNSEGLKVEADDNLMQYIDAKVKNNTLEISSKEHISFGHSKKMKLYLTFKQLNKIEVSGAGNIHTNNPTRTKDLDISISGAARLNMDLFTQNLKIEGSGASSFTLGGKTENLSIEISGAGSVDAYKMEAQNSKIEISGTGSAETHTTKSLDVEISGAGSVKYKGTPTVKKEISGIGSVRCEN